MNEAEKSFDPLKLCDEQFLKDNLTFASLYIAIYEFLADYVETKVKELLRFEVSDAGETSYPKTQEYINAISNRVVDESGNRNVLKASFLWLCDEGAITQNDYDLFLQAKKSRNKFAHELTTIILKGVSEEDVRLLFNMLDLFRKINKWWFMNIDVPIMGYKIDNPEEVKSFAEIAFDIILQVLYNGKSDEYKRLFEEI